MAIIRPGTYTIKEKFTVPSKTIAGLRDYKYYPLTANDTCGAASNSMGYMYVYDDSITLGGNTMYDSFVYGKPNGTWNYQYATEWDDDGNTTNSVTYTATDTTKLRTIIVETDQTVDDEFYAWFNANIEKPRLSVDVSTLAGWANLSAGEKSITIVAKAAGYKDSAPSAAVQVTKAASTKTLKAGTYKWKDIPNFTNAPTSTLFDFLDSNGSSYFGVGITGTTSGYVNYFTNSTGTNYTTAFNIEDEFWENTAYKTITLATDQQVSADFYEWAITGGNLVKQTVDNGITTDTPAVTYSGTTFTPVSSSTSSQSQLVKSKVNAAINDGSNLQTALNSISPDIWTTLTEDFTSEFLNSNVKIRDIGDFLFTDTDITRLIINCEAKVYFFVMYYGESWMPAATFTNTIDLPSSIAEEGNAVAGFIMLSQVPRS